MDKKVESALQIEKLPLERIAELADFIEVSTGNAEDIFRKLEKALDGLSAAAPAGFGAISSEVDKVYRREMDKLKVCSSTLDRWRGQEPNSAQTREIERIGWELTQLQSKYLRIIEMAEQLSAD
ncbi:MAG: hypothetical protein K2Y32_13285 [Candidatus Obscuribacterales bacterium]|nr:hypothetical protein [Candidatus Obscuribacterales bacterium]